MHGRVKLIGPFIAVFLHCGGSDACVRYCKAPLWDVVAGTVPASLTVGSWDVQVSIDMRLDATEASLTVEATAETFAQTGVEMEAMVAATVASLTVYDMVKGLDKSVNIVKVQLEAKSGGKSGDYRRRAEAALVS